MQKNYTTERLLLQPLGTADAAFIYELVNTAEWKKFIGERNVHNLNDAVSYIQTILLNNHISYRVVRLKNQKIPAGVITFIKRAYLAYPDIGFAFLPQHTKKGYALEASKAVLEDLFRSKMHDTILATTLKENTGSIQLLSRLGFVFVEEIVNDNTKLQVYQVSQDKFNIPH